VTGRDKFSSEYQGLLAALIAARRAKGHRRVFDTSRPPPEDMLAHRLTYTHRWKRYHPSMVPGGYSTDLPGALEHA
jgi:hypothetical protein